jgi:hypothetical protein
MAPPSSTTSFRSSLPKISQSGRTPRRRRNPRAHFDLKVYCRAQADIRALKGQGTAFPRLSAAPFVSWPVPVRGFSRRSALSSFRPQRRAGLAVFFIVCSLPALRCRDEPRAGDAPLQPAARPPAVQAPRGIEPPSQRSFRLDRGAGTERLLAAGGVDSYRLDLQAGQFLHLIVDQRGVDVTVAVHSPGRGYLFRVDSPNSDQGPEDVYVVAEGSGEYRFDVAGLGTAAPGRYLAHIETLRPAQASDRSRADAERAFARGQELAAAGPSWQAVAELEQALRLFTRLRAVPRQAYASYRLGQLYMGLSRPEDGLVLFEDALAAYRALPPSRANSIAIGGSYNEL